MATETQEYTPPPVQVPRTSWFNRIGFGGIIIGAVLLVLLGVACWNWYKTHRGKIVVEKHVVALQADSVKVWRLNGKLQQQANDALVYAETYRASRDSAIVVSDRATGKLTYSQKVVAYLKALVDNKTLPASPDRVPDLISDEVVTAGLKTANREEIERKRGDSLVESIAVRDARILALRHDKLSLKSGLVKAAQVADEEMAGGVWPFNQKRKNALKRVKQANIDALKKVEVTENVSEESELEQISNGTKRP